MILKEGATSCASVMKFCKALPVLDAEVKL